MANLTGIRWGITFAFTFIFLTVGPFTVSGQECPDTLESELIQADKNASYDSFIEKYSPCELAFVAVQRLALPALLKKNWQSAAEVFEKYRNLFPNMGERFSTILATLAAPTEELVVKNIGPEINTAEGEFRPVLTADGEKLYFARDCGKCDGGEDIFVSLRDGSNWQLATELGAPVASDSHEMPTGISSDGTILFLFGNYPGSFGRGDIFFSENKGNCWSEIEHYPAPVNSAYFESDAMMSADGKAVFFVSERPGGIGDFHEKGDLFHGSYGGNTDIYVYATTDTGGYELINLGATINTPFSEYSPFLHPDGKTLYFSSDGHGGLGGLDVYKATRLNNVSWTEWSKPVNLGKEINSPFNDWSYQISTSGDFAYFAASNKFGGYGGNDIYAIGLPSTGKPQPVITVRGKVTDPAGKPLGADLRWNDLAIQKEVGKNRSDPATGKYFIALPAGNQYSYFAEKEGYMGKSEHFDLRDMAEHTEYILDIVLYPVGALAGGGVGIRLNNVFFDFDKYDLRKESFLELDRWADFLKKNESIVVQIQGHTDSVGTEEYNQQLSEKRAQAVAAYLAGKGIQKNRIPARGFGESKPVTTNDTNAGRQLNRRVEIRFGN